LDNIHLTATLHRLEKGFIFCASMALMLAVLQRLVLTKDKSPASYLGPEESFFLPPKG
jgi:hypothetical protein